VEHTEGGSSGPGFTRLRITAGLSVRQLADTAHVWPSSVCRVERGGHVTREVRDALVQVLGPEASSLIGVWPPTLPDTVVYRARKRRGESGREVARRAGVSKDAYARAEHGKPVSPSNARKIAEALGLDDDDLVQLVRPKDVAA